MARKKKASKRAMTAEVAVELAKRYLEPHQPEKWRLNVAEKGVRQDEDWWYVLVRPSRTSAASYEYYGRLAEAEIDLQEKEGVNVTLVPVFPG